MRVVLAWLPACAIAGLIWVLSDQRSLAVADGGWDFVTRKSAHLAIFGALSLACLVALRTSGVAGSTAVAAALVLTAAYAIVDELHQRTVPTRTGRASDVLIDLAGALLALVVLRRRRPDLPALRWP